MNNNIELTKEQIDYWNKRSELFEKKRTLQEDFKKRLNNYVNTELQKKYKCKIGLVYNKLFDDIEKYNSFMIYKEGYNITHEAISIKGIKLYNK